MTAQYSVANAPLGTVVWLWENYKKAEYVVAKHNYAAAKNGNGYDLLIRLEPLADTRVWDGSSSSPSVTWEDCDLREWLYNTFAQWPEDQRLAQAITLPLRDVQDKYFVLDTDELTGRAEDPLDGNVVQLLLKQNNGHIVWGQDSISSSTTESDGSTREYRSVYCWFSDSDNAKISVSSYDCNYGHYVQPCFVVKGATTAILEDGMLRAAPPPEIVSDYFGSDVILTKRGPFQVPYRVKDANRAETSIVTRLDGKYIGFETSKYGELHWATVDEEHFAALSNDEDHVLTIRVMNGASMNEKSFKFRKAANLGYILYMGKIAGTADGKGYYWTERAVLHDSHDPDGPLVLDPELELEKNNFGSLSFMIPAGNPCHEKIGLKKTVVSVEADGTEIWCGYVTELTPGYDLGIEVYCEGELGYLQDRDCDIEAKTYTVEELVKLALTTTEERFAKEGKTFLPGSITMEKPESKKDENESKDIQSAWDILNSNLVSNYGGYLRLRKEIKMENGKRIYTRYLDYLRAIPDRTEQTIAFGENMLDLSYYLKVNTLVNSVIARGFATRGWWIFSTTDYLEVKAENKESIEAYGLVQRIVTVDGTNCTQESLQKVADEHLKNYRYGLSSGLEISAADLADTGVNVDRLEFLKNTHIVSKPHGLDDWVLCTKMTIPIDAPENKDFTFGDSTDALSSIQATNYGTAGKAWNAIRSTIGYMKG